VSAVIDEANHSYQDALRDWLTLSIHGNVLE